jgi:hypothetical protein
MRQPGPQGAVEPLEKEEKKIDYANQDIARSEQFQSDLLTS